MLSEQALQEAEYFNGLTLYSPEAQVMPAAMSHVRVTLQLALSMQKCIRDMADRIRSLEATPARVTDEMVERFITAYTKYETDADWFFTHRDGIRAALTAAITEGTPDAA